MADLEKNYGHGAVSCPACFGVFELREGRPCGCITNTPTIVCPRCESCSCTAEPQQRHLAHLGPLGRAMAAQVEIEIESLEAEVAPLVLVADDSGLVRSKIGELLGELGFRVIGAADGREAWRLALEHKPDIAVLDALMPGFDGRELSRLIKTHPEMRDTRVIVVTGLYQNRRYEQEAYDVFSVDEFLPKPLSADVLERAVVSQLSH